VSLFPDVVPSPGKSVETRGRLPRVHLDIQDVARLDWRNRKDQKKAPSIEARVLFERASSCPYFAFGVKLVLIAQEGME
jgi:hypothetical protein